MKKISIVLVIVALIALVGAMAQAQATKNLAGAYNRVVLDGSSNQVTLYGTENMVKENPVSGASVSNVATTTLTVITPVSNRARLIIRVNTFDTSKAAFVNLGGSVATDAYGIRIDYNTPLDVEVGEDVEAAVISSGAAPLAIIQTVRE